jgi:hypothetical protein
MSRQYPLKKLDPSGELKVAQLHEKLWQLVADFKSLFLKMWPSRD